MLKNEHASLEKLYSKFLLNQSVEDMFDYKTLFNQRDELAQALGYLTLRLNDIEPSLIQYSNKDQKTDLQNELLFYLYVARAQLFIDSIEKHKKDLVFRVRQILKIGELIARVDIFVKGAQSYSTDFYPNIDPFLPSTPVDTITTGEWQVSAYTQFLGLDFGRKIKEQIEKIIIPKDTHAAYDAHSKRSKIINKSIEQSSVSYTYDAISRMSEFNQVRMSWVWSDSFIRQVLLILPDSFGNKQQTLNAINTPAPYLGAISWVLYYTRFSIELGLLLKHTIKGPWMDKRESEVQPWARFKHQWQARKFALLNDSIWATVNLVTFFWLVGSGLKGYYGDVLTTALLLCDLTANLWRYSEEQCAYDKKMAQFEEDERNLFARLSKQYQADQESIKQYHEWIIFQSQKEQFTLEWKYKQRQTVTDLCYATGLVAGFAVMCHALNPPTYISQTSAVLMGAIGGSVCLLLTIAYTTTTGVLQLNKTSEQKQAVSDQLKELQQQVRDTKDGQEKNSLGIKINTLTRKLDYFDRLQFYQQLSLARNLLVNALMPAVVFSAFMFFTLPVSLGLLGIAVSISIATQVMINQYKPQEEEELGHLSDQSMFSKAAKKSAAPAVDDMSLTDDKKTI